MKKLIRKHKFPILFLMGVCVFLFLNFIPNTSNPIRDIKTYKITKLNGETIQLFLEESVTSDELQMGLMYRTELAPNHGMIFIFEKPQKVSFWMKNTFISLDLIMIDELGKVVEIHPNQNPRSTTQIPSHSMVQYVIELQAGEANALGIKIGSKLVLEN